MRKFQLNKYKLLSKKIDLWIVYFIINYFNKNGINRCGHKLISNFYYNYQEKMIFNWFIMFSLNKME